MSTPSVLAGLWARIKSWRGWPLAGLVVLALVVAVIGKRGRLDVAWINLRRTVERSRRRVDEGMDDADEAIALERRRQAEIAWEADQAERQARADVLKEQEERARKGPQGHDASWMLIILSVLIFIPMCAPMPVAAQMVPPITPLAVAQLGALSEPAAAEVPLVCPEGTGAWADKCVPCLPPSALDGGAMDLPRGCRAPVAAKLVRLDYYDAAQRKVIGLEARAAALAAGLGDANARVIGCQRRRAEDLEAAAQGLEPCMALIDQAEAAPSWGTVAMSGAVAIAVGVLVGVVVD